MTLGAGYGIPLLSTVVSFCQQVARDNGFPPHLHFWRPPPLISRQFYSSILVCQNNSPKLCIFLYDQIQTNTKAAKYEILLMLENACFLFLHPVWVYMEIVCCSNNVRKLHFFNCAQSGSIAPISNVNILPPGPLLRHGCNQQRRSVRRERCSARSSSRVRT